MHAVYIVQVTVHNLHHYILLQVMHTDLDYIHCMLLYYNNAHYTRGKIFSTKMNYKYGWACKKYGNKAGMKTQEHYPTKEIPW